MNEEISNVVETKKVNWTDLTKASLISVTMPMQMMGWVMLFK